MLYLNHPTGWAEIIEKEELCGCDIEQQWSVCVVKDNVIRVDLQRLVHTKAGWGKVRMLPKGSVA